MFKLIEFFRESLDLQHMDLTQLKIIKTGDSSSTLFVPELDEHYHSYKGAVQESQHVFIKNGLEEKANTQKNLSILEIGLGTGLNAYLTLKYILVNTEISINYTALEKYPLDFDLVKQLNYASDSNNKERKLFSDIHQASWNMEVSITERFRLMKKEADLTKTDAFQPFDLVYFDAFAPEKQPEMWDEEIFRRLFRFMNPEGILVTYCAKGEVRRRMKRSGFNVERLPGPPGKREMLRAIK